MPRDGGLPGRDGEEAQAETMMAASARTVADRRYVGAGFAGWRKGVREASGGETWGDDASLLSHWFLHPKGGSS